MTDNRDSYNYGLLLTYLSNKILLLWSIWHSKELCQMQLSAVLSCGVKSSQDSGGFRDLGNITDAHWVNDIAYNLNNGPPEKPLAMMIREVS